MKMELQSRLSFYEPIAELSHKKNITLVRHVDTGQIYVKKELQTYDRDIYEWIQKEQPPFVPHIYECLEDAGRLYVIEEYVQGMTLEIYMEQTGCLTEEQALFVWRALCQILYPFHHRTTAVIHRDIKPSNVILQGEFHGKSQIQSVYLIDFNTARIYDEQAERDTELFGTRGFAAPEQYGFGQSDVRTDIYALGVLLNYMLNRRLPSELLYDKNPQIMEVIRKATMLSPEERYSSTEEMMNASLRPEYRKQKSQKGSGEPTGWRRFLPPGFRRGNIFHMLLAILYELACLDLCLTMDITEKGVLITGTREIMDRIAYAVILLPLPLLWGNYLDLWRYLPFLRSPHRWVRFLAVPVYTCLWFCLMVVLLVFVEDMIE